MFIKTLNFIWIDKEAIPPEYEELLDHEEPTTLRLEALSEQEMCVEVLEESPSDKAYEREIVMFGKEDHIPKELAHIKIFLENLPKAAIRRAIIDKKKPFGKVITARSCNNTAENNYNIPNHSRGRVKRNNSGYNLNH